MRNRRLLTLAVLAVAIGFSAYAQAADNTDPYGTAVLTVIQQDPNTTTGIGDYTMNIRLWGDGGVGTTALTPGLLDFAIKDIAGTGTATVTTAAIIAPYGIVSNAGSEDPNVGGGFSNRDKRGIRYAGPNYNLSKVIIPNSFNAVGYQPVAYDANGTIAPLGPNPLRDAAILYGVGTTGRDVAVDANTQNHSVYADGRWISDPGNFAGDTPIISGTYQGIGGIAVTTWGVDSFDVLPGGPTSVFVGPAVDANTFGRPVKAVIVQTTTLAGNDGGAAVAQNATSWQLVAGDVVLGSAFQAGQQKGINGALSTIANVTLNVDANAANTSVTLGAYQVLKGLSIATGLAGNQKVDVAQYGVAIYTDSTDAQLNQAEAAVLAAMGTGVSSGGLEGLVSSDPRLGSGMSIGFARKTDLDAKDYLDVKLTFTGDSNVDGFVDGIDLASVNVNWDPSGGSAAVNKWYLGDMNLDGFIDGIDLAMVNVWWNPSGTPITLGLAAPAVPEPATLGLLALGALGLIRRRRA